MSRGRTVRDNGQRKGDGDIEPGSRAPGTGAVIGNYFLVGGSNTGLDGLDQSSVLGLMLTSVVVGQEKSG